MHQKKMETRVAPQDKGVAPRWTSSAKDGVGTAIDRNCRVWFTVSHGIVNEAYFPFVDIANTRDMELIVTGPDNFLSEEKRDMAHTIAPLAPGYHIVNTCKDGRFEIHKTVLADPHRDVLVQRIEFKPLKGVGCATHYFPMRWRKAASADVADVFSGSAGRAR